MLRRFLEWLAAPGYSGELCQRPGCGLPVEDCLCRERAVLAAYEAQLARASHEPRSGDR